MLLITTALMLEARPLVARLGLRSRQEAIPVYENATIRLVVTGTGPLRAAAATGWAFGRFGDIRAAMNVGFCGALPSVAGLHEWLCIHSVRDQQTGRVLIPEILYQHPFPEAPLLTVPQVVREPLDWDGAVDMEGAAFFEASRQHLPLHQLVILKWVSDPLTGRIDPAATEAAFTLGLEALMPFMEAWVEGIREPARERDPALSALLALCGERLRLTATQRAFLEKWLRGYALRGGTAAALADCLPQEPPKTRRENTQHFDRLRDALKG